MMKQLKSLPRLVFIFSFVLSFDVQAVTLKEMAQTSNFILVLADRYGSAQKKSKETCHLDQMQISEVSQKLKIEIDAKLLQLKTKDYEIIKERISNCEKDCTCDIYSLALENKGLNTQELEKKASLVTAGDREKCFKLNSIRCSSSFFKALLKN